MSPSTHLSISSRRQWLLRTGAMLCLPTTLAACYPNPLRLGSIVFTGYEPIFLARDKGWLPEQQVRLIELLSNTDTLRALAAERIEGAQLTLDEFLTARAEGLDLRILAVLDQSAGADAIVARPGLHRNHSFKGLRVAVEEGAVGAVMLGAFLSAHGLAVTDVQKINMTLDQSVDLFHKGAADLFITAEPWITQLEEAGGKRVFDSTEIPGRIVDVMVVRANAIEPYRDALHTLVAAHFKALTFIREHPTEAAQLMAPRLQISPEQMTQAMNGLIQPDAATSKAMLLPSSPLTEQITALQSLMLRNGLISTRPQAATVFEPRFHPATN